jgi:hypothetical protein
MHLKIICSAATNISKAFSRHKMSNKEGLLKPSLTVFIMTAYSESQNRHKWSHL